MISIRAGKNRQVSFKPNRTNRWWFFGVLQGSSQESSPSIHVIMRSNFKYVFCEARNVHLSCSQSVKCLEVLNTLNPFRKPSLLVVILWLCSLILCHLHSTRQEKQRHVTSLPLCCEKETSTRALIENMFKLCRIRITHFPASFMLL